MGMPQSGKSNMTDREVGNDADPCQILSLIRIVNTSAHKPSRTDREALEIRMRAVQCWSRSLPGVRKGLSGIGAISKGDARTQAQLRESVTGWPASVGKPPALVVRPQEDSPEQYMALEYRAFSLQEHPPPSFLPSAWRPQPSSMLRFLPSWGDQ